jgi:hypothetical protein
MTREKAIEILKQRECCRECVADCSCDECENAFDMAIKALEQEPILNKIRAEIKEKNEQEDFARSVFINEEKDYRKANQCTSNLQAYEKVLDMIDNLLKENKDGRKII